MWLFGDDSESENESLKKTEGSVRSDSTGDSESVKKSDESERSGGFFDFLFNDGNEDKTEKAENAASDQRTGFNERNSEYGNEAGEASDNVNGVYGSAGSVNSESSEKTEGTSETRRASENRDTDRERTYSSYRSREREYVGEDSYSGRKDTGSVRRIVKKQKSGWGKVIPMAIAGGAIAGGIFVGIAAAGNMAINSLTPVSSTTQVAQSGADTEATYQNVSSSTTGLDVKGIAASLMPCMVELNGKSVFSQQTFFGTQEYEAASSGTGIIIGKSDDELLILTNAHVVEDIDDLQSMFTDGSYVNATIKGSDASVDVAVVAVKLADISEETMNAISIAQLDDSGSTELGEQVVAIGNALGEGQSVTVGYVSALDRSITVDGTTYSGLIMTDAAINSGNSGGALINPEGKVIGINFASSSYTVENMAYAIPIANVKDLINSMMTQETRDVVGESEASYLGITGVDITGEMHQMYGYPQGLLLRTVEKGSPADQAGLTQYDIITSFDGKSVTTLSGLQNVMKYYKAGETVTIEYYHMDNNEYVEKSTEVTLGSRNN